MQFLGCYAGSRGYELSGEEETLHSYQGEEKKEYGNENNSLT